MNAPLPHQMTYQQILDISPEIIVDLFAGGGGVSEGVEMALGLAKVPHKTGGAQAALTYLRDTAPGARG